MAKRSWIQRIADRVEQRVRRQDPERRKIVCASGVSPSGPIHLGNMREVMTVHLVAEDLRQRGWEVDHLHSWDDFDRLRKVPAGLGEEVGEAFAEQIGRPLAEVPDPFGEYESYAERYIDEFEKAVARIGVTIRPIRQARAYRSGIYVEPIKRAMEHRLEIFDILAEHQTPGRHEKPLEERRREYYPFRVYCHACRRDSTAVTGYEAESATVTYRCECGHGGSFSLEDEVPGKLVWKVDWPMRWRFEGVDFEPGGEDHSAPGSSFTVGQRIVREVYGGEPPHYVGYAFVGIAGQTKISSSAGTTATPGTALRILEPAILRWLYIRRNVHQQFSIDFGKEMLRVYDEWDTLGRRAEEGKASEMQRDVWASATRTSAGPVARAELPVSFRLLSSAADLTQGNLEQVLRIVGEHLDDPPPPEALKTGLEPRLSCAIRWVTAFVPDEERTRVKGAFDQETWEGIAEGERTAVAEMLTRLDESWTLAGLTRLVYGVPKLVLGHPIDADPTPEIQQAQRTFFIALYSLLVGADTGPRLPTLLLSLGKETVRDLLTPPRS